MRRKLAKFRPQLSNSGGSAILTKDQVKGHFDDHGRYVHQAYQVRLREFSLSETAPSDDPRSAIRPGAKKPPPPEKILVSG
jgi:hypothetical protein